MNNSANHSVARSILLSTLGLVLIVASSALAKSPPKRVKLHVDASAAPGGRGSASQPFQNLPEAVAHARTLAPGGVPAVIIKVAPGIYPLTETLRLDIPNLELRGSNELQRDSDGWPTGVLEPETETKAMTTATISGPLIFVTVDGVTIRNLTMNRPDAKGETLQIKGAQDFTVTDSCLIGPASIAISTTASSGNIVGNYISGAGCGACLAAGSTDSPARVKFTGNRSVGNTNGGVLLAGGLGFDGDEVFNSLSARIERNDLSGNKATPGFSFGIRIYSIRRDPPDPFLQTDGHVTAFIADNRVYDNEFGVVIDAGFPYRTFKGVPDDRAYTGSFDLTFADNHLAGNRAPALITFTRNTAAINQNQLTPSPTGNSWKYLVHSVFMIEDQQNSLAGYWLDHPETDPISGDVILNTLIINGREIARGRERIP